jgi:hypothetical protein
LIDVLNGNGATLAAAGRASVVERFSTQSMAAGVVAAFDSQMKKAV